LLVGLLVVPGSVGAQQAGKVYRIGFLANAFETSDGPLFAIFLDGLKKLGYVEGQNFVIDWRSSEGDFDRLSGLAQELIRQKVDIIVASSSMPARAAAEATQTIPVVFPVVALRPGEKLAASLGRPGGNVTGLATYDPQELNARLLRLLKEAVPKVSRLAVLTNPANAIHLQLVARELPPAAHPLKVSLLPVEARAVGDLEGAFDAAVKGRADSLYVLGDPLSFIHRARIAELAVQRRLPTIHTGRANVEAGGLMSYGPKLSEVFRRAATYVDRILKGAAPSDLPVDRSPKFEMVLNLKTARALGLHIPPALRQRADELIQ
jgi:putative ABC transport system substrate-binding protein